MGCWPWGWSANFFDRYKHMRTLKKLLFFFALIGLQSTVMAQERTVRGTVRDRATSDPLAGVSVVLKGTNQATSTGADGSFTIGLPTGASTILVFTYVGYKSQELPASVGQNLTVFLEEDINVLDEVVAIGYGTTTRRDVTGAIASIGSDKIMEAPVASAIEAIQGRLPGVNISLTEGAPDAEINIRVRGGGSISQDNSPLYIVDGFPVPSITDIAPSDIESIDVLKDASSAAIYGSRGANGVVIITTKSGKAGRFSVNYNVFGGPKRIAKTLDVLTPYDYALWQYESSLLTSRPDRYTNFFGNFQDIDLYQETSGNDWQKQTFGRTGHLINNNLNINGGSEKTRYAVNYTNVNDKAIMQMSDFKRDNLTLRLNSKPYKPITIDVALRYSNTRINGGGTNEQNEVSSADSRLKFAMIFPPIPVSGLTDAEETDQDFNLFSPLEVLRDNDRFQQRINYNLNGSVAWDITNNLRFKTEGGLDYNNNADDRFYGLTTYYIRNVPLGDNQDKPAVVLANLNRQSLRTTNTLTYNFSDLLPTGHKLNLLAGQEFINTKVNRKTNTVHGFPEDFDFDRARKISSQGDPFSVINYFEPDYNLLSFFGRVNYDYDGRYIFSSSFRSDGSSRFGPENKWAFFPSVSAAWRISGESFMENTSSWLDDLKLRASFGEAGNDRIDEGQYFTQFMVLPTSWVNGFSNYVSPSKQMPNPELKWETTISRNIGLDYTLLGGKLSGAVDIYQNNTRDLLINFPVFGSGYNNQFRNMGETRNRGIELVLNWKAVNKANYGLDFGANIAFNRNKILSLGVMNDFTQGSGWASTAIPNEFSVAVGGRVGQMLGYRHAGRYEVSDFESYDAGNGWKLKQDVPNASAIVGNLRPGVMKLHDLNNDKIVTSDDRTLIGDANPKHTGGFNINARAFSFDLTAIFTWSYGNDIYNANKIEYTSTGQFHSRNMINTMASGKRWTNLTPDGMISNDPAQLAELNQNTTMWSPQMTRFVFSDWAVEDGSFLRLNTLSLGYSLPKSLLANARIQNLRLYASAYNVFTLTNYSGFDPEVSTRRNTPLTPGVDYSAYPRSRMLVFGLNFNL